MKSKIYFSAFVLLVVVVGCATTPITKLDVQKWQEDQNIDKLINALNYRSGYNYSVRDSAAIALGQIGDLRAVQPIINARNRGNISAATTEQALLGIKDTRAIQPLINALGVSYGACEFRKALVNIGSPAVEPLILALSSPSWELRKDAAIALGEIVDARAIEPLCKALRDEYCVETINITGFTVSGRTIGGASKPYMRCPVRIAAATALGKIGKPAIIPLSIALKDEDTNVRREAVNGLKLIKDPTVIEVLIYALNVENDLCVRDEIVRAFENTNDLRAVDPLINTLKNDASSIVRGSAAMSLEELKDPRSILPLIEALNDEDALVRLYAAWALLTITGKDFGDDKADWIEWWEQNKESFLKDR